MTRSRKDCSRNKACSTLMTTNKTIAVLCIVACISGCAFGAYCHGKPKPDAKPNAYPINKGPPNLVKEVKNAKAYKAGEPGFEFWVVHLYGTPYEMGYAQGEVLGTAAGAFFNRVWDYLLSQVADALSGLPTWLADDIGTFGLDLALDLTAELTANFTGEYFFEELRGLADATNVPYQKLLRIHLLGELTKGDCSMYGAWGKATASTGKTLQLRSLDWDIDGPFKDFSTVQIYHPAPGYGNTFANVGFLGWIGALSGMSSKQMAISEIGVSFPDATFGEESRMGVPFTFLLRDILQWDSSYVESIRRIQTANRTCDLILGVGDGKANASTFRGFQYSYSVANVMTPTNQMPYNETWHPRIPDMVYYGMDWDCPSYNQALAQQIQKHYGDITPENTIADMVSIVQTGDVHSVVYDLTDLVMYVSFARPANGTVGPLPAYDRQFTQLNMKDLFAEKPPQV